MQKSIYPTAWKLDPPQTTEDARAMLYDIAVGIRGGLFGLGLYFQSKQGDILEIAFSEIGIVPDGDGRPIIGLFIVDTRPGRLPPRLSIDQLCNDRVLHHLSSVIGRPVLRWNSTGLAYAVLLRPLEDKERQRLPQKAILDLRQCPNGRYKIGLGVSVRGGEWYGLEKLDNILVAGEPDIGKSTLLRSLVYQAMHWKHPVKLFLADLVGNTFAPVEQNRVPILAAPVARDVEAALAIGRTLFKEIARRDRLYSAAPGYPEKLSEYHKHDPSLPLIMWIVDETPGFLNRSGGKSGDLAGVWADLAQQGRKYGVYLVMAGQNWRAEILPPILRDNLTTRIVFRLADANARRTVLSGRSGPDRLNHSDKGRAWCLLPDGYRQIQTFFLDKSILVKKCEAVRQGPRRLSEPQRQLVLYALRNLSGRFIIGNEEKGVGLGPIHHLVGGRWQVRRLAKEWENRGLLTKPKRNEKGHPVGRFVTPELARLAGVRLKR